jgi:hypothetical protein
MLILATLGAAFPRAASAQAPAQGFGAYAIVQTRNIFDPNRNPFVPTFAPPPRRRVERPQRYEDSITLTGIMVNGGKAYAFFFGSSYDDDKVLPVNGEIAGAKLTKITPTSVELNRNGKAVTVPIGQTMTFDSSSPGGGFIPGAPVDATAGALPPDNAPPAATPLPGNLNEVMRRMMERRQQELQ